MGNIFKINTLQLNRLFASRAAFDSVGLSRVISRFGSRFPLLLFWCIKAENLGKDANQNVCLTLRVDAVKFQWPQDV